MPKFAANLSMMFAEHPFLDRFAAAADAGFEAVEYLFPYEHPPEAIAARLEREGLALALFNLHPGDFSRGERGFAALPERAAEFHASVDQALRYAEATQPRSVHVMSGNADRRDPEARAAWKERLRFAAEAFAGQGVAVTVEPLNRRDMPGYFLDDFDAAVGLIGELETAPVRLQYDIYHRQILHGDVATSLASLMPLIGHVQTASVPKRNEPGTGELNDDFLFRRLDELGYDGYVGCEYRPAAGTREGLGWFKKWRPARAT